MIREALQQVQAIAKALQRKQWMLVTAESCTGGGLAQRLTAISGSSNWFERGYVTYSNASKQELLGVHAQTIEKHGAVSEQCALEMAQGALKHSKAQLSLSITGIAGPTGGTAEKPVGLVWFGWADSHGRTGAESVQFKAHNRIDLQNQAVAHALKILLTLSA